MIEEEEEEGLFYTCFFYGVLKPPSNNENIRAGNIWGRVQVYFYFSEDKKRTY